MTTATQVSLSEAVYELRSPFLSPRYSVPIDKARYDSTVLAKRFLLTYMAMEESVLQILYSAQNFEEYLLRGALEYYLFSTHDYQYFRDMRLRANIHVGGVLNSITSFRDQFPKFSDHGETEGVRALVKKRWDELKSESVSFAFGERLRNYAQHQSQPVDSATTGGGWDEGRTLLESHLSVYCDVSSVVANRDIKQAERERYLAAFGEKADLALVLREMIGKVGVIVREVREYLAAPFEAATQLYDSALSLAVPHSDASDITEIAHREGNLTIDAHSIFTDFTKRARRLRSNMVMTNNELHFISNKARGHETKKKRRKS